MAIYGLVVEATQRGKRIGYQFLAQVLQELVKKSRGQIYLEVETTNHAALHLYQKLGFQIIETFDYYLWNNT